MLVLLDRGFDGNAFLAEVHATGAALLARAKPTRNPGVLTHLPDGSCLSDLDGLDVRIIEAEVAMTGADGSRTADQYRLITTLTDHNRYPALTLIRLYHERRETRRPAWPCGKPCPAATCCAQLTEPDWNRNCGRC